MIKITIKKITTESYLSPTRFMIKETPTGEMAPAAYGGNTKPVMATEYEVRDIPQTREQRTTLLTQEIEKDEDFNLKAVVAVTNKLDWTALGPPAV